MIAHILGGLLAVGWLAVTWRLALIGSVMAAYGLSWGAKSRMRASLRARAVALALGTGPWVLMLGGAAGLYCGPLLLFGVAPSGLLGTLATASSIAGGLLVLGSVAYVFLSLRPQMRAIQQQVIADANCTEEEIERLREAGVLLK